MIKKLFILLSVAIVLCLTFCTKNHKSEPSVKSNVENALNFDSIVVKDYETVKSLSKDSVAFYEAQIVFNRLFTSDTTPVPVRVMTVMQAKDTVWTVSHAENEAPVISKEYGYWLEDLPVNLSRTKVSLDSAIACMNKANIKNPASNYCVFRKPLYKEVYKDAFYIFGSVKTSFVSVDCNSGKVQSANLPVSSGRKTIAE